MRWIKRGLDLGVALVGLAITWPLFLGIALAVKWNSPGPVFFSQERVGRCGRPFQIRKFRTMVQGAERMGARYLLERDDPRITRVGAVLRRFALDELPQLINVLRGEMSLVGPRPTLAYQIARYDDAQRRRLMVQPGMTGWAWVRGGTALTWPQRIELDVWYVDHWSLGLDLKILWQTLAMLFQRKGVEMLSGPDEISRLDEGLKEGGP